MSFLPTISVAPQQGTITDGAAGTFTLSPAVVLASSVLHWLNASYAGGGTGPGTLSYTTTLVTAANGDTSAVHKFLLISFNAIWLRQAVQRFNVVFSGATVDQTITAVGTKAVIYLNGWAGPGGVDIPTCQFTSTTNVRLFKNAAVNNARLAFSVVDFR